MYDRITELPLIASTTGDGVLAMLFGARRAREKLREAARGQLRVKEFRDLYLGRAGRTRIEPSFLLPYVRVSGTTPAAAQMFERDMQRYGVLDFATGGQAPQLESYIADFVRSHFDSVSGGTLLSVCVNRLLARLTLEDDRFWQLAERQREQWRNFSRTEQRFTRLPGRLVRVEGSDALMSVWNEAQAREELRAVDADQLADIGVSAEGDPLMLYETEYAPGVRVSTVLPAVEPPRDAALDEQEERELRRYETPLPTVAGSAR